MEFRVYFISNENGTAAIDIPSRDLGLDDVEAIRRQANRDVSLEVIKPQSVSLKENPHIVISEETAKESGYFNDTNVCRVNVNKGALNRYVYEEAEFLFNEKTGVIDNVIILNTLNKLSLETAWKEAGYPLESTKI